MSLFQFIPFVIVSSSLFWRTWLTKEDSGSETRIRVGPARELVSLAITRSPQPAAGLCLPGRETPAWMRAYTIRQRPRGQSEGKGREGKRDKRTPLVFEYERYVTTGFPLPFSFVLRRFRVFVEKIDRTISPVPRSLTTLVRVVIRGLIDRVCRSRHGVYACRRIQLARHDDREMRTELTQWWVIVYDDYIPNYYCSEFLPI